MFLKNLLGTKEEENTSYENCNLLVTVITALFLLFSVLEPVLFYLYNFKVQDRNLKKSLDFTLKSVQYHPWIKIINGTNEVIEVEDDNDNNGEKTEINSRA